MHAPADVGVKLITAPFLSLGAYIYAPRQSFRSAQEERRLQIDAQEQACCTEVINRASPAQLRVLQAFAAGLGPQQIAHELNLALVTVNTHKTALLAHCRNAWNVPLQERLDYHFLRAKFATSFQDDD
jgi:CRISPR-associated protein Csx14